MENGRTQWFKFVEYRPVHVGWYEGSAGEGSRVWQVYWDGTSFRTCAEGVLTSASYWRGLTFEEYGRQRFNMDEDARVERELANRGWMGAKPTTEIDWERWAQRHTTPLPKPKITMYEELGKFVGNSDDAKPSPSPYEIQKAVNDSLLKTMRDSIDPLRKAGLGWPAVNSRIAAEVQLDKFLSMEPRRLAIANYIDAKARSNEEIAYFSSIEKFIELINAHKHMFMVPNGTR
jgi:hypothetical protein